MKFAICSSRLMVASAVATAAALPALGADILTGVLESGGDTDRPSAKMTGQTFDIENPTGTVLLSGYTVNPFGDGAKSMTDRLHAYAAASTTVGLPWYLVGGEYVMIANNDRDNADYQLALSLSEPATVYLLIDNRLGDGDAATLPSLGASGLKMAWVDPANGWYPVTWNGNRAGNPALPDEVGIDESADGSVNNWSSVYSKNVPAGITTLEEYNDAGRNMYGVVVTAQIPEPSTLSLLGLGALALLARRRN